MQSWVAMTSGQPRLKIADPEGEPARGVTPFPRRSAPPPERTREETQQEITRIISELRSMMDTVSADGPADALTSRVPATGVADAAHLRADARVEAESIRGDARVDA